MSRAQKALVGLVILLGLGALWAVGPTWFKEGRKRDLVITTATEGGTYIVVGRQMARILTEYPVKGIDTVKAIPSPGSDENIIRLLEGTADLALVFGPTLVRHPRRDELGVLLVLYHDVWQVVVRKSTGIQRLADLKSKRIFVGPESSATRWGATQFLESAGISESDYSQVDVASYGEASAKLQAEEAEADAAFFLSSTPAVAVKDVMSSGCCRLLDLKDDLDSIKKHAPDLSDREIKIPPYTYPGSPAVQTLGGSALLIARKDLDAEIVSGLLDTAFDRLGEFEVANIRVQDVRLNRAFDLPERVDLHDGATMFKDREKGKLWIATGVINGKYHNLGKRIQLVLQQRRIPARVIHTDGSIENLKLFRQHERVIAITQYDTALASLWTPAVYDSPELVKTLDIPHVEGLRRIAALHKEIVHVLIRRDRLAGGGSERPTLRALENARVCLGAPGSGTRVLARLLLHAHGVTPKEAVVLSVPDMVARINSGELDAGFFVSHVPSEALKTVANDHRNVLLSVDPRSAAGVLGAALSSTRIAAGTYGAQLPGEPPIDTLSTQAVLVATEEVSPGLVERIAGAIFEAQDFLGIRGGETTMAQDLKSLALHPGAQVYYERRGFVPPPPGLTWSEIVGVMWRALAILVILVGGYQGVLKLKRDRNSNRLGRRILSVFIDKDPESSILELVKIRDGELLDRVRMRWWKNKEIDKPRWRDLHELINDRIKEAKENAAAERGDLDARRL